MTAIVGELSSPLLVGGVRITSGGLVHYPGDVLQSADVDVDGAVVARNVSGAVVEVLFATPRSVRAVRVVLPLGSSSWLRLRDIVFLPPQ